MQRHKISRCTAILEPVCIPAAPSLFIVSVQRQKILESPSHRHLVCPYAYWHRQTAIFVRKIFGPKFIYYLSLQRPVKSSFSATSNQGIPIFVHIFGSNDRHLCSQNIWSQIYILFKSAEAGEELIFQNRFLECLLTPMTRSWSTRLLTICRRMKGLQMRTSATRLQSSRYRVNFKLSFYFYLFV